MIHFKNHNGFTLLEAIFALAIAAIVLTPLFILQGNVLQRVSSSAARLQRMFFAQNYIYEIRQDTAPNVHDSNHEKKIDDPGMLMQYSLKPVQKKSSLASVEGLLSERVSFSWEWQSKGYTDQLVTLLFKPPSE